MWVGADLLVSAEEVGAVEERGGRGFAVIKPSFLEGGDSGQGIQA